MLLHLKYTVALLLTILLLLSYASLEMHWRYSSPTIQMPDPNFGILPGMFLYGLVQVENSTMRAYELSMASHAPFDTSKDPQSRVSGLIRKIDSRDDPRVCKELEHTDLQGSIALVERGNCNLYLKIANCQAKGARAVLISESPASIIQTLEEFGESNLNVKLIIPSMILTRRDYDSVAERIDEEASVWTLSAEFDPSIAQAMILLLLRPVIMCCIVLLVIFINMQGKRARRRSSPRSVWSLPRRIWKPDSENVWHQRQCSICLEDFVDLCEVMTLPCSHEYHVHCVSQWLLRRRNVCPICCREVNPNETTPLLPYTPL